MVVGNKPGAGGTPGGAEVVRAAPDGDTRMRSSSTALSIGHRVGGRLRQAGLAGLARRSAHSPVSRAASAVPAVAQASGGSQVGNWAAFSVVGAGMISNWPRRSLPRARSMAWALRWVSSGTGSPMRSWSVRPDKATTRCRTLTTAAPSK
ncbi:MAG: hypothetical protein QE285_20660 [Aquabacterium sp.]|nr:hypothetical protein [Aquabacterium sp.]